MPKRINLNNLPSQKTQQKQEAIKSLVLETEGVFYPKDFKNLYQIKVKQIQTCICLVISGENGVYIAHINNNNASFQKALLTHIEDRVGKFEEIWITKGDKISISNLPLEAIGLFATREKGVAASSSHMIVHRPMLAALKKKCAHPNIHVIEDIPDPSEESESLTITVTIDPGIALPVSVNSCIENSRREYLSELRTLRTKDPARVNESLRLINAKETAINSYLYNPQSNEQFLTEKISANSCPSCQIM